MSLSSIIVQREIATMRQVEEALARQVLYGGDLVTNLLEVAPVDEDKLTEAAAEAVLLRAGPSGVLPSPDPRARPMIPAEMASRWSIYPLSVSEEGDELTILVAEPLPPHEEEQLMFALGVPIVQRIAPLVRIRQALTREFGAPLDRRFERLMMRLAGDMSIASSSLPPLLRDAPLPGMPPRPPSTYPYRNVSNSPLRVITVPPPRIPTRDGFPAVRPSDGVGVIALDNVGVPPPPAFMPEPSPLDHEQRADGLPLAVADALDPNPLPRSIPPFVIQGRVEAESRSEDAPVETSGAAPSSAQQLIAHPKVPDLETLVRDSVIPTRPQRRRRGPLTFEGARALLDEINERDSLLDLLFDFSRQYFEYTVLFIVHGDQAEGREAFGSGASRDKVAGIQVPLDTPSVFASVREQKSHVIVRPDGEGLDAVLLRDLERTQGFFVMVAPVVVRSRVVAILYGDAGEADVDREGIADVTTFALLGGQTLERMILKKKLGFVPGDSGSRAGKIVDPAMVASKLKAKAKPSEKAEDRAQRVEALGRALFAGASSVSEAAPSEMESAPPPVSLSAVTPPRNSAVPVPPPASAVSVRRLSHPPIPREEPDVAPTASAEHVFSDRPPRAVREERLSMPDPRSEPVVALATVVIEESPRSRLQIEDAFDYEALPVEEDWSADRASSSQVIVPARTPPAPHTDGEALPTVIVDVSRELDVYVERYLADPSDEQAEGELLREGHQAMPAIMARFPGPIHRIPTPSEDEPVPTASSCGSILRLIAMQRRVALPWVLEHVDSRSEEKRFWATFLLGELAYAEALPALVARLLDPSDRVQQAARWAAAGMARHHGEETARELGRIVRDPTMGQEKRLVMLEVLEEIREPLAVPTFIAVLNDDAEDIALTARRALLVVARQDFGRDTRRWTQWWNAHSSRDRIEWLIDALVHETQGIRRAAGEELKAITKEYFGYYDDLPKRDRERAQARYHDWWATEGRARFTRPT